MNVKPLSLFLRRSLLVISISGLMGLTTATGATYDQNTLESPSITITNSAPRSGEAIYNQVCTMCHSIGVAGAPKFGNAGDWAPRSAKGYDELLASALRGLNAMPPRGTCSQCSDEEILNAIKYMVEHSK